MKTTRFLFALLAVSAGTLGSSYAGELPKASTGKAPDENHPALDHPAESAHRNQERPKSDRPEERPGQPIEALHPPKKIGPPGPIKIEKTEARRPLSEPLRQAAPKKAAPASRQGTLLNKAASPHERAAKAPSGNEALASRPGAVRGRRATAALVGRVLVTSNAKYSEGPLNSAAVQRKP
jgi:hypothetical protein